MAKGVTKIPERYRARVKFMGKYVLLGNFLTEEVAEEKVRAAEKAIKSIESTASRSFEEWLGLPQDPVLAKPLTKAAQKAAELLATEKKIFDVAVYMHSLMNFKGPAPVFDWGRDRLEEYIMANKECLKPVPVTDAFLAKQREQQAKLREELSERSDMDEEYGDHSGELPLYEYDFDKTATDSDGECYLIDNYETSVDPDCPEYMMWINRQGVAEFKTEY